MTNRIEELDVIRGFAIFGILICNIVLFGYPYEYFHEYFSASNGLFNNAINHIRFNVFADRTFTIFSLLFGIGIGMQYNKFMNSGKAFTKYHISRMLILLFIGLFHGFFIWFGDVLSLYAILGMLVLFFIKLPTRYLIIISVLLFILPSLNAVLQRFGYSIISSYSSESIELQKLIELNSANGVKGHFTYNISQIIPIIHFYFSGFIFYSLSMIILGISISKNKIQYSIKQDLKAYKLILIISALILTVWHIYSLKYFDIQKMGSTPSFLFYLWIFNFSIIAQTFFIISLIIITYNSRIALIHRILHGFKYIGRMSLSNYILHSIFGILIFKILGFYGRSTPTIDLILVLAFTLIQMIISKLWIQNNANGPIERFWRQMTKLILK